MLSNSFKLKKITILIPYELLKLCAMNVEKISMFFSGSLHLVNQRMTVGVDLALDQHVGIAVAEALVDLIAHKVEVSHPGLQWSKRRNEPLQLSGMMPYLQDFSQKFDVAKVFFY